MDKIRHGVNIGFRHTDLAKKDSDIEKGYTLVSNKIFDNNGLSASASIIYIYISSTDSKKKLTQNEIARELNIDVKTAQRALRNLENKNLLKRVHIPSKNEYVFVLESIDNINKEGEQLWVVEKVMKLDLEWK